jgi:hypothetical protein
VFCNYRAHLYKYHTIYQCQRCKRLFNSDDELDSHIMEVESCTAITAPHVDGITKKIKEKLQCKRKAYPAQTEAARWKQIYQILFPEDEEVPDPCKFSSPSYIALCSSSCTINIQNYQAKFYANTNSSLRAYSR